MLSLGSFYGFPYRFILLTCGIYQSKTIWMCRHDVRKSKMVIWCKFCVVKCFHPLPWGQAWQITLKLPVTIPVHNKGQACLYVILTGQESIIKNIWIWKKKFKACGRPKQTFEAQICVQMVFQVFIRNIPHWPIHLRGCIYKIYQLLGGKCNVNRVNVESN